MGIIVNGYVGNRGRTNHTLVGGSGGMPPPQKSVEK